MSDKDLLEQLKEILAKAVGDPPAPPAEKGDASADEEKTDPYAPFEMAKQAAERHRTTVKWIVGAYAAIWTVLVGTAPFAGLGDLDTRELCIAGGGLLVAGVGALAGIFAASRVLEPEDSSLGELAQPPGTRPGYLARLIEGSGQKAARDKRDALFTSDKAYFGPGAQGSTTDDLANDLIGRIQDAEAKLWTAQDEAADAGPGDRASKERTVEAAKLRYERLCGRRNLTLAVAAIYELRGKYWASRRLLMIGAALVLIGTLGYLSQVVAESDDKDDETAKTSAEPAPAVVTPAQVRLKPETWRRLNTPSGGARCFTANAQDGKTVADAYVLGDAPPNGPWTVVVLPNSDGSACRPVTVELKLPAGRVVPATP